MKKPKKVVRKKLLSTFTVDRELLRALRQQARREGENQSLLVRRALRAYLESVGALTPAGKIFGPTRRASGRTSFPTREAALESMRPGDRLRPTPRGAWVIERPLGERS